MPSSKKLRGRQRKVVRSTKKPYSIQCTDPRHITEEVRRGDKEATDFLWNIPDSSNENMTFRQNLFDLGIVQIVLDLLHQTCRCLLSNNDWNATYCDPWEYLGILSVFSIEKTLVSRDSEERDDCK